MPPEVLIRVNNPSGLEVQIRQIKHEQMQFKSMISVMALTGVTVLVGKRAHFCGVDPHVNPETLEHLIRTEWASRWETGQLLRGLAGLHRAS